MLRFLASVVFLFSGLAVGFAADKEISMQALNELVDNANVIVDGHCSGTLIDVEQRLVLTNFHCVTNRIRVKEEAVVTPDGTVKKVQRQKIDPVTISQKRYDGHTEVGSRQYRGEIVGHKKTRDLALIQIKDTTFPNKIAMKLLPEGEKVQRGMPVTAIGNPMMLDASVSTGVIASTTRTFKFSWADNEDLPMYQFTAGIAGGSSGGSLIASQTGELIGVPAAVAQGTVVGLAIPIEMVREALREWCFASVFDRKADDAQCRKNKSAKVIRIQNHNKDDLRIEPDKTRFEPAPFVVAK